MSTSVTRLETLPALPTPRGSAAVAEHGNLVYVLGGGTNGFTFMDTAERYDPKTRVWQPLPPMLAPRSTAVSAVLGDRIFVIGGIVSAAVPRPDGKPKNDDSPAVEYFDVASGSWHHVADLPYGLIKPCAAALAGKLYLVGGQGPSGDTCAVLAWTPDSNLWEEIAQAPLPARHAGTCVLNGRMCFSGGASGKPEKVDGKKHVPMSGQAWTFAPGTREFERLPDLTLPRAGHGMAAFEGALYVIGGVDAGKQFVYEVEMLAPGANAWQVVDRLDTPRALYEACVVNDKVYLASGWNRLHKEPNPTVQAYALRG